MSYTFINGANSISTYLIIGQKKEDQVRLAMRRLLVPNSGTPIYRLHAYPNFKAFALDAEDAPTSAVVDHGFRDSLGYETLHLRGDEVVKAFLLPGLASRGVRALEFDEAVEQLKGHSPDDNTPYTGPVATDWNEDDEAAPMPAVDAAKTVGAALSVKADPDPEDGGEVSPHDL